MPVGFWLTSCQNDSIINKITKHINIISILKHSITGKENNIIFKAQD